MEGFGAAPSQSLSWRRAWSRGRTATFPPSAARPTPLLFKFNPFKKNGRYIEPEPLSGRDSVWPNDSPRGEAFTRFRRGLKKSGEIYFSLFGADVADKSPPGYTVYVNKLGAACDAGCGIDAALCKLTFSSSVFLVIGISILLKLTKQLCNEIEVVLGNFKQINCSIGN